MNMNYSNYKQIDGFLFEKFILNGAGKLKENIKKINDLNVFPIPDGDTGDNMFRTFSGGIKSMQQEHENSVDKKAHALAVGMLLSARGNSGVILSQIFAGLGNGLEGVEVASIADLSKAFSEGVKRAYSTVVTPVEGTILTVAREALEGTNEHINENITLGEYSELILSKMKTSLANTPELLDVLKEAGVVDSGGAGLYMIAQGVLEAIRGNSSEFSFDTDQKQNTALDFSLFGKDSVFEYGYCTEFLLRLMTAKTDVDNFDINRVIEYLETIGDSIVALKEDSILKIHVHTMTPSKVLEFCQQFGEFLTVKIENMMLQHNEHEAKRSADIPKVAKKRAKYASCVVTSGSGNIEVFRELGADHIIDGGQGKNPSTGDFIKAFDEINADNIFVFPNNSNIFMAAEQAGELYGKSKVHIIPSINPGQAYASLAMLDYSSDDPVTIKANFISNMEFVETGMVCKAIRNVDYKDLSVRSNDYIGFTNKKVLTADEDKITALRDLCEKLGLDDKEIVTVFYGTDATDEDKQRVRDLFKNSYRNKEFYEVEGNQEIYDFIIVLE